MGLTNKKTIVFVTGTRADFGKLKPLVHVAHGIQEFEVHLFVTGMHLLRRYGYTANEIQKIGLSNLHKYINQNTNDSMDVVLAKTISGFSDFVKEVRPDMIVVHGDRVEALACAIVGSLNNILVSHIEGGEVSGTIDELLRHSITKLSHLHLVCNDEAQRRLIQMGEEPKRIKVIGSPDLDVMSSSNLPSLEQVRSRYQIPYDNYAIFMYHPVTTELESLSEKIDQVISALLESDDNYIVIYPNNDQGSDVILEKLKSLEVHERFCIYPSLRFEFFLSLLKYADYIIGNSSAGVREAPFYGVPTINLGTRQNNRAKASSILNTSEVKQSIRKAIYAMKDIPRVKISEFGSGNSAEHFREFLLSDETWLTEGQKHFKDVFSFKNA